MTLNAEKAGDRPVTKPTDEVKIEITPEMIEAGGQALWLKLSHDPLLSPGIAEDLAEVVLLAALCSPVQ